MAKNDRWKETSKFKYKGLNKTKINAVKSIIDKLSDFLPEISIK